MEKKISLEQAKEKARRYCGERGLSYEKLLTFEPVYSSDCWIWTKPYAGPLTDEAGNIMDLQTLPTFILAVPWDKPPEPMDGIDFIRP